MTVDCERAANLISSRVDGELAAADAAVLDAHLAGCAACRAALETAELDDAAMVRAFAAERQAAAALACRVAGEASAFAAGAARRATADVPGRRALVRWAGWAAAAAAGFVGAVLVLRPADPPAASAQWPVASAEPIARLALASGDVFTCPREEQTWRPMAKGAGLTPGAKVRTVGAAKCELTLPGGSRLRLNSDTELCFTAAGDVQVAAGQVWSDVPHDAGPLRIAAGKAEVTPVGPAAQFDVACATDAATVTVVAGSARVNGPGHATTVRGGEFLRVGLTTDGAEPGHLVACTPVADPLEAARWLDDLLLLLPADDPELSARVDALLARIVAERSAPAPAAGATAAGPAPTASATAPGPGDAERDVRARGGEAWAAPLARYVMARPSVAADADRDKRRTAARLLSDLAPPSSVPDLIALLSDDDGDVRFHAAAALNRLTGLTLGFSPFLCATTPRDAAPSEAWQAWWARNRSRYPAAP